jgi:exportin-7
MDQKAQQLQQFETVCNTLYTSPNQQERDQAQHSVLSLQTSAEYIPQCQYILDNSKSAYALLVAASSLTKLISTHWNNFTTSQRVDVRNYILGYLATNGPSLTDFVTTSLIKLVCRITKLGWFDDTQHQEFTKEITKFLQATIDHCIIGLQILNQLVMELNLPTAGRTLTQHRKTAVSFRDKSLFHIFQLSLTTLRQLQMNLVGGSNPQQESRMAQQALMLAIKCLSFDFIGTNPDESAEDVGAVQVPSTWRSVIQEPATMQLLFDIYSAYPAPQSSLALECLMLLASVRRSLFSDDKERKRFLTQLMVGICRILQSQQGLNDAENYHEFCRLLGRLKSNYQLSELVKTEGYQNWIDLVAKFTINSFQQWQWSSNSMHYLLGLWARLVVAVPYVKPDLQGQSTALLDGYIPQLVQAYIQSRLDSVEASCTDPDTVDDLLDEEG